EHCEICDWWVRCNARRRDDDHLSFVAGISKRQIGELRKVGINTLAGLANSSGAGRMPALQARLQLERRTNGTPVYELLNLEPERGLALLPEPSPGDIFLDFESDPFVEEGGIEYLLGYVVEANYTALWALDRMNEKRIFETFIDLVMER